MATTVEIGASARLIEIIRLGTGIGLAESAALGPEVMPSLMVRPLSRYPERMLQLYRNLVEEDAAREKRWLAS